MLKNCTMLDPSEPLKIWPWQELLKARKSKEALAEALRDPPYGASLQSLNLGTHISWTCFVFNMLFVGGLRHGLLGLKMMHKICDLNFAPDPAIFMNLYQQRSPA